jgi:hypothetical protein
MDELSASLEALDMTPKRRITVPPPPTDDYTEEISRPALDDENGAPDDVAPESESLDVVADAPAPVVPRSGAARPRGRGLAIRRPNGPMKAITASLPADIVDRLTQLRLDAEVEGKAFKLTEVVSAAVLSLPLKPSAVSGLIDRYSTQINYGRSTKDEGFLPEERLSTQITPDAARHLAAVVRAVYQQYSVKLSNKDLYAIALLEALANRG